MSIDHRAYLFQYEHFQQELADLLYQSLQSGEVDLLRGFINQHCSLLTDPLTEQPLADDWEEDYGHEPNVQRYADLALTKYYDLSANFGLKNGFDALGAYLRSVSRLTRHADGLICGRLFGPKGNRLDPGRMGTGLLSPPEAKQFARILNNFKWPAIPDADSKIYAECHYPPGSADEVLASLNQLLELYRRAARDDAGILLADFNDRGVSHL